MADIWHKLIDQLLAGLGEALYCIVFLCQTALSPIEAEIFFGIIPPRQEDGL